MRIGSDEDKGFKFDEKCELTKGIQQELINLKTKQRERKNVNMKNRKMNNKGFSLVELIIVIAIMAVLVGVLAPAYLRYVEKSRKSADVQAIDAVMSAMEAAAIDPSLNMADGDTMVVTLKNTGVTSEAKRTDTVLTNVKDELELTIGTSYKLKSSAWDTIAITGEVSGGKVLYSYTAKLGTNEVKNSLKKYAPDLDAALSTKPANPANPTS